MGIMAIAAVFALAVIGTAGAFGYRALFGSSGPSQPPPVIKADTAPSKIVPVTASKTPNKLITDRVADHAQDEKLVSREEQPVEMKNKPAAWRRRRRKTARNRPPPSRLHSAAASFPASRRKSTPSPSVPISPDWAISPAAVPPPHGSAAATAGTQWRRRSRQADGTAPPPHRGRQQSSRCDQCGTAGAASERGARRCAGASHPASAPSNAPLSLSPDAPAARAPMRTAAVAAPAPIARPPRRPAAAASGSYAVQVSSQRSEADAQAAFRSLQAKYPNQLGGRQALIHKVELGDKGTYYRAMVGPFASANEASELCSGLKAAGGQCLVQRN